MVKLSKPAATNKYVSKHSLDLLHTEFSWCSTNSSVLHTDETNGCDDDRGSDCAMLDLDGFSMSRQLLGTGRNLQAVLVSSDLNFSVAAEDVSKPQLQHRPAIGLSSVFRLLGH